MDIAIVAATELELSHLKRLDLSYPKGKISFSTTGVGAIPTTFALSKLIHESHPQLIIQIGIAGAFTTDIIIGSSVTVANEVVADMGVFENGNYTDIFQMGLSNPNDFPYTNGGLMNSHQALLNLSQLPQVTAVSVNEISTDQQKTNIFHQQYGAAIESMEGAAFHYACLSTNTPFIQLRGISNVVGVRDKSQWNIPAALASVTEACKKMIESL